MKFSCIACGKATLITTKCREIEAAFCAAHVPLLKPLLIRC